MKEYGAKKATEFTKKQISVIYSKAKNNELKIEKWVMSEFYDLADYYGFDDNRSVAKAETSILRILDKVFSGNLEEAQELINDYTEKTWELMGRKSKERASRELVA